MPDLSVIVPAVNEIDDLVDCLAALDAQRADVDLEVLVIDRLGEHVRHTARNAAPWARIIAVPADETIPMMRARGFREATGDAIAVIEDHVMVPPGWARAMLDALTEGVNVVGGSVENAATETLIDWAAFLCEYSHCLPPIPSGPADWLTGNNVVYRRSLIEEYQSVADEGGWENRLHDQLKADGHTLMCHPEIVVGHKKHYSFGEYFSQRYLFARAYAGARVMDEPTSKKVAYGLAAFALPPVLFYRTVTRILSKRKHTEWLWRSIPLLLAFVTSWGAGEVVGYLRGPGDALSKVR